MPSERALLEQCVSSVDGGGATEPAREGLDVLAAEDALALSVGDSQPACVEHGEHIGSLLRSTSLRASLLEGLLLRLVEQPNALRIHLESLSSGLAEGPENQTEV